MTTRSNGKLAELFRELTAKLRTSGWAHRAGLLIILAGPAWWLDPLAFALSRPEHQLSPLTGVTSVVERFGEPVGVALVCLMIWTLDRLRRRAVLRLLVAVLIAGTVAAVMKLVIGRERPRVVDGRTVVRGPQWPGATKDDPSFPSAHATVSFALAQILSQLYPHGRAVFIGLAALCGFARIYGGVHFLTDVFTGSWLGWELGKLVWNSKTLGQWGQAIPEFGFLPAWSAQRPDTGEMMED